MKLGSLPDKRGTFQDLLSCLLHIMQNTEMESNMEVIWEIDNEFISNPLLESALKVYSISSFHKIDTSQLSDNLVKKFALLNNDADNVVTQIELELISQDQRIAKARTIISYIFDELICNMQQHSGCSDGMIHASFNDALDTIDICIADTGVTIYGSYVKASRYLDLIGNNAAEALSLAKDGYSTKNRPDVENRGYGISTNAKMITKGLHGSFSILSGNALLLYSDSIAKIASLPENLEWQGTCVLARIPVEIPSEFNIYNYIS